MGEGIYEPRISQSDRITIHYATDQFTMAIHGGRKRKLVDGSVYYSVHQRNKWHNQGFASEYPPLPRNTCKDRENQNFQIFIAAL